MVKEKGKKSIRNSVKGEARTLLTELKRFSREAGDLAQRGGKEITRVSQIGKLKGEIVLLDQKRQRKIKELGEKVMRSKKKFGAKDSAVLKAIEEIKKIEEKKKFCGEQIKNLTKK